MARAYAIALRLRVIKAVEAGIRISKVSKLFNVSRSMIAGFCNGNLIAPVIFEGNCNTEVFRTYIRDVLITGLSDFLCKYDFSICPIL